jgi:hypothetical protein
MRFYVKLNGGLSDAFIPSQKLHQGDPLSPYLFFFHVEGFSTLLKKVCDDIMIKGVKFGSDEDHISHLISVDDIIVFLEASVESMHALKEVL